MPPSPTLTNGIYVQIPAYYIERSEEMIWTLITLNTETGALETQAYHHEHYARIDQQCLKEPFVGCIVETACSTLSKDELFALVVEELAEQSDRVGSLEYEIERLSGYEYSYEDECATAESLRENIKGLEGKIADLEATIRILERERECVWTPLHHTLDDKLLLTGKGKAFWSLATAKRAMSKSTLDGIVYVRHLKSEDPEEVIQL